MNPLLDFSGLPRFAEFKPEFVTPAVDTLLQESAGVVERLTHDAATPTWDNFVAPLDNANERVSRAWGQVNHMNAVMNSPVLREVYNANLPKITQFYAELGQNQALFAKYKALRQAVEFANLSPARQRIVDNELRDFRLSGAELSEEKKARFLEIQEEQSALASKFSENILDATNAFSLTIESEKELSGIPADVLQTAAEAAKKEGKSGWKFTLHAPSYLPVLQYAKHPGQDLRLGKILLHLLLGKTVTLAAQFFRNISAIPRFHRLQTQLALGKIAQRGDIFCRVRFGARGQIVEKIQHLLW